jgi:hypothetical protein
MGHPRDDRAVFGEPQRQGPDAPGTDMTVTGPGERAARGAATWTLVDAAGGPFTSMVPGTVGGHRRSRIYGRLDCPAARRALARGHYAAHRVFFLDEVTARRAGYRPCAVCLPEPYRDWRARSAAGGTR